jgi:hypothetical protein
LLFAPAFLFILHLFTLINRNSLNTINSANNTNPPGLIKTISNLFRSGSITTNPLNGMARSISAIFESLPDSLIIGSFLLSATLQSLPLFGIFLTLIELSIGRVAIGSLAAYISPSFSLSKGTGKNNCMPGVSYGTMQSVIASMTNKIGISFPSETMFILGGLASYVMSSVLQFREELIALGPEWESRIYIIGALIGIGMLSFIIHQVGNNCSGLGPLLLSGFMAVLAGVLISYQNKLLMGREAINLLGLPFLDSRVETGAPLYVCSDPNAAPPADSCPQK